MRAILPFLVVLLVVALFTRVDSFFYLLYTLCGIYILGRIWAKRSLSAVLLHRQHDAHIFLGETVPVQVEVRNQGWLPVLWLRVQDTVPANLGSGSHFRQVISLLPRERRHLSYTLAGKRRGYYPIGPLVTLGGDLLGSVAYENHHEGDDYLIVYPKIVALSNLGFPSYSPFGTLPSRERLFEDPTRIQGVRDYQPGDSLRRMDWKTSARVGSLQVRRYEPAIALETALFLNLNGADYPQAHRADSTELGIVVAASIAAYLVEKRQAVGLVTNGRDPWTRLGDPRPPELSLPLHKGRAHLMQLLDLLACIEVATGEETVPFPDLLTRKSLGLPYGSTVVVITAREVEGLMELLLTLRRRGLLVALVLSCPDRGFQLTAQRAAQIGIQAFRVWSERDLDIWR